MIPVASTQFDRDGLLSAAQAVLGRSISASLDAAGRAVDDLAALPAMAAELVKEGSDPLDALRSNRLALRHLHFTFLVEADRDVGLMLAQRGLAVSRAQEGAALVSGTMTQWYWAVVESLMPHVAGKEKKIFCTFLAWFEKAGLHEVWGSHQKIHGADGLYHLVPK